MKILYLIVCSVLALSYHSAFAVTPPCENLTDNNEYAKCIQMWSATYKKSEDKKHTKVESKVIVPAAKLGSDKKVCEALKATNDVYKTYLYAESLGAVQVNDFHGAMYRNTNDKVNRFIDEKCSSLDTAKLVDESTSVCYSACNSEAAAIFKNDKKKMNLQQRNCDIICSVDNMAKVKLLDGVSIERKSRAPADCSNPTNDSISNLGRNAKDVVKKSSDSEVKGAEGKQR